MGYEVLFEDEYSIFSGTPKTKFWDITHGANDEIVQDEYDKNMEQFIIMEQMLQDYLKEKDLDNAIKQYSINNQDKIEMLKKDVYIQRTGDIVMRLDS